MTLKEARTLLNSCIRTERKRNEHGDLEITWARSDGKDIAYGYTGGIESDPYCVSIMPGDGYCTHFKDRDALSLMDCGQVKV